MSTYKRIVWDIEANGLLHDATKIWCLVAKNIDTKETTKLVGEDLKYYNILPIFIGADEIIGHNIISYDLPMLKLFYDLDIIPFVGKESIVDTYVISKVLNPDREMPKGCPTTIRSEDKKLTKRIGPHGLEAWGYRVGRKKIEIHDWTIFDDNIVNRCETDVDINIDTYFALMSEAGMTRWRDD